MTMVNDVRRGETGMFEYEPRRLWSDPVATVNGYRVKPYRLAFPDPAAEREAAAVPLEPLLARAIAPADDPLFHGLAFAILHVARDGNYLLVGRWYAGNNLMSEAFEVVGDTGAGACELRKLTLFACVWEMAVYGFERDCWIRTVMAPGQGLAGAEAYLACRFEGWV